MATVSQSLKLNDGFTPVLRQISQVSNNAWKSSQPASHEYRCMGVRSNSAAVSSNLNYEDTVASTAVMYKGLALPAGDYEVYFDWRAGGEVNGDYLSVCLITNPNTVLDIDSGGALPSW